MRLWVCIRLLLLLFCKYVWVSCVCVSFVCVVLEESAKEMEKLKVRKI